MENFPSNIYGGANFNISTERILFTVILHQQNVDECVMFLHILQSDDQLWMFEVILNTQHITEYTSVNPYKATNYCDMWYLYGHLVTSKKVVNMHENTGKQVSQWATDDEAVPTKGVNAVDIFLNRVRLNMWSKGEDHNKRSGFIFLLQTMLRTLVINWKNA